MAMAYNFRITLVLLGQLVAIGLAQDGVDFACTTKHCLSKFARCFSSARCFKALICLGKCNNGNPRCAFDCGYFGQVPNLLPFIDCSAINKCSATTVYGSCHGNDEDAYQSLTTLDPLVQEWWNIRGLDCGASSVSPGYGWDNFPCHHETITKDSNGNFMSNEKFCYEKNGCGSTDYITQPHALKQTVPGVFVKKAFTPGSEVPLFRKVHVIGFSPPDVYLVSSCSKSGSVQINRLNVVTSQKDRALSEVDKQILTSAAAKVGVDFGQMCTINNTNCQ